MNSTECQLYLESDTARLAYRTCLFLVTVTGVLTNSLTLVVLIKPSKSLRNSTAYVFLVNQTVTDLLVCSSTIVDYALINLLQDMVVEDDTFSWIYCRFIYSQVIPVVLLTTSSYNLAFFSFECMASVLWPLHHRVKMTKGLQKTLAVSIWIGVAIVMTSFAMTSNSYSPEAGFCFFWSGFSSGLHKLIHLIVVSVFTYPLPMSMMLVSYTCISCRSGHQSRGGVVITATRVMLAYGACVLPASCLYLAKALGARLCEKRLSHKLLLLLLVVNSVVNPLIYATRYDKFTKEMKRKLSWCFYRPRDTDSGGVSSVSGRSQWAGLA